jgi:hypothetical protein
MMESFIWDVCGASREDKRSEYLKMFEMSAWDKLNDAISKHIQPTDESIWGDCKIGAKGLEIYADVNGTHIFDTKCILAGGWIQSLHYRYISHLKSIKL